MNTSLTPDKQMVSQIRRELIRENVPSKAIRYEIVSKLRQVGFTEKMALSYADSRHHIPRSSYRSYLSRRKNAEAKDVNRDSQRRLVIKYHTMYPYMGAKSLMYYFCNMGIDISYNAVRAILHEVNDNRRVIIIPFKVPENRIHMRSFPIASSYRNVIWNCNSEKDASRPGERFISDSTCLFSSSGSFLGELTLVWDVYSFYIVGYQFSYMKDDLDGIVSTITQLGTCPYINPSGSTIHTDNGKCFLSEEYNSALEKLDITHQVSPKGSPRSNAQAEALIGMVKREIHCLFIESTHEECPYEFWKRMISYYVIYYNTARGITKWKGLSPQDRLMEWRRQGF